MDGKKRAEGRERLIASELDVIDNEGADEELDHYEEMQSVLGSPGRAAQKRRAYSPQIPESWVQKSAALLENLRPEQREVLAAFGLSSPLLIGQVGDYVRAVAAVAELDQPHAGLSFIKAPSTDWSTHGDTIYFHRVTFQYPPQGFGAAELEDLQVAWRHENPLSALSDRVDVIKRNTALEEWAVVAFLLADASVVLPWVNVTAEPGRFGPRFTIDVGTADVPAEDVRTAYNVLRRELTGGKHHRSVKINAVELVRFVRERSEGGRKPWTRIWREWLDRPGVTQYKSWRAMKRSYDGAVDRLGSDDE